MKWNFFATSHGKGVVDGVGGTVKRAVWRHVRSHQAHVSTPEQYSEVATQRCPNVHIKYIPKEQIDSLRGFLDKKWENVVTVPGTHQIHFVQSYGPNSVKVADTSCATEIRIAQIRRTSTDGPDSTTDDTDNANDDTERDATRVPAVVGNWIVVLYDNEEYPGEVTGVFDNDVEVNVMHKTGNAWKWPTKQDKILYGKDSIVRRVSPPKAAGHRGQFTFDDM